jgi:hypothetical protein
MEERKFRLITTIDRINYFSDSFISYYKKWFFDEEFYFMVHHKNYEDIKNYLFSHGFNNSNIQKYEITTFGEGHNVINQNSIKTKFIKEGYIVVYADIDEFIYHPDLRQYILNNCTDYIIPQGIQIIHAKGEPPLDFTKTVMEQRNTCIFDRTWYSKVCILKSDFKWDHGRHNKPIPYKVDSSIYLIDMGKVCKQFMIINNEISSKLYKKVMWRYKETNLSNIEREVYNKISIKTDAIPNEIKKANPF